MYSFQKIIKTSKLKDLNSKNMMKMVFRSQKNLNMKSFWLPETKVSLMSFNMSLINLHQFMILISNQVKLLGIWKKFKMHWILMDKKEFMRNWKMISLPRWFKHKFKSTKKIKNLKRKNLKRPFQRLSSLCPNKFLTLSFQKFCNNPKNNKIFLQNMTSLMKIFYKKKSLMIWSKKHSMIFSIISSLNKV